MKKISFPGGVKFVPFTSLGNVDKSVELLEKFLKERLEDKPQTGHFKLGTHFIKFVPENMSLRHAWQVSSIHNKYVAIYNFSDILNVFIQQRLDYHPRVFEVIKRWSEKIQNGTPEQSAGE